jgi:hypothetical protein
MVKKADDLFQIIKERTSSLKMSICDPDTSDEESHKSIKIHKPKAQQRRTKATSPKPQRVSENIFLFRL